jgi:hypothetical protein
VTKNIWFYLDENDPVNGNELVFTNQKPYVIYGYAAVPKKLFLIQDLVFISMLTPDLS